MCLYLTESNEKKIKRKMRREKRKLLKKKIKSNEPLDTLMSELPFALTSPTSWKELECMYWYIVNVNDRL